MKVCEVLDDVEVMKTDLKSNRGKAIGALVRGAKRKANNKEAGITVAPEQNTATVMG